MDRRVSKRLQRSIVGDHLLLDWVAQELLSPRRPRGVCALIEPINGRSA